MIKNYIRIFKLGENLNKIFRDFLNLKRYIDYNYFLDFQKQMKFMITALLLAAVSAQVIEPDRNCCKFYPEDNYHPSNEPT